MDHDLAFNGDLEYTVYGGETTQVSEYFEISLKTGIVKLTKSVRGHGKNLFYKRKCSVLLHHVFTAFPHILENMEILENN